MKIYRAKQDSLSDDEIWVIQDETDGSIISGIYHHVPEPLDIRIGGIGPGHLILTGINAAYTQLFENIEELKEYLYVKGIALDLYVGGSRDSR